MAPKAKDWLISPRSFIQLIGAEYELLNRSGRSTLLKFYISAVAILLIMLISALSIFYAMELLFHMLHVEILLAIFVSLLFAFIYIFLLHTFSKATLKSKKDTSPGQWHQRVSLADTVRTVFVVLMAFLISKPIEVFFFKRQLSAAVETHRTELLAGYTQRMTVLYQKDIAKLEEQVKFYREQLSYADADAQVQALKNEIVSFQNKQIRYTQLAEKRIARSDFLLFCIHTVCKRPLSWAICMALIVLFLLPGYLIYSISANDDYFKMKKEMEIKLVQEEYRAFEQWYRQVFHDRYQLPLSFYCGYTDPPFNTQRKAKPSYLSQTDFLNKFSTGS